MMSKFQLNLLDECESYYPFTDYEDWQKFKQLSDELQSEMIEKTKIKQIIKQSEKEIKEILFTVAEVK